MRTVKHLSLAAALLFAGLLLAVVAAYLLVSDEKLIAWLTERTAAATGITIRYQKSATLSRTLSPTLRVRGFEVTAPEIGYRVHSTSLELQVNLPRLILGQLHVSRLWLGETRIESNGAATPAQVAPSAAQPFSLSLSPAFHDVKVDRLSIVHPDGEMRLPTVDVDQLSLHLDSDTDTLVLRARLQMAGEAIDLQATVPDVQNGLRARHVGFSVSAQSATGNIEATGHVDLSEPEFVLDGKMSAQAYDLEEIPTGIEGLAASGSLDAQAQFHGTVERLAMTDVLLNWQGPGQSGLVIEGGIDDLDDLKGIALDVSGQLGDAAWLMPLLPDTLGTVNRAELSARLSGDASQLNIRDFSLSARDTNQLQVSLRGQFDMALSGDKAEPENLDVLLTFKAPTTRAARALLFEDIPEFGAVQGSAHVRSSETGYPTVEDILVSTRDPEGIEIDLSGRIASLPLDPAQPNLGYDLDVSMRAKQPRLMGERLGLNLPIDGPAEATYRIAGDTQALRLEEIKLRAGNENAVRLNAEGQVHFRDWDQPDPLWTINVGLRVNSRDTQTLAKLLGPELPELGALTAKARLRTVSDRHQITEFELRTAKEAPVSVLLSGTADRVVLFPNPAVEGMAIHARASTTDVARLNRLFGWQHAIPAIGPAEASATISGSDQKLLVSGVSITAGRTDTLLLKANGRLGALAAANAWQPQGADLRLKAHAPESKAFATLLGYVIPELGPIAASAQMRSKASVLVLESGRIRVGGDPWKPVVQAEGSVSDLFGAVKTRWDVVLDLDGHQFAQFADYQQIPDLGALHGEVHISNSDGSLGIDNLSFSSSGSDLLSLALNGEYGDLSKPDSLSLTGVVNARDLEIVGALLDRDWPAIGPFRIETRLSRLVNNLRFDTSLTAGKAVVHADLVATLEAKPLLVSGKIVARNAFVPSLVKWTTQRVAKKRVATGPVFSRSRIPFDWMHKFDMDLSVDVESFDPELSRAQSAQATIAMSSGRLWVRPATIKYPVGQLKLDMQLDARDQPRFSIRARGEDLYPQQMLYMNQLAKDTFPDLDIDIDLSLSGNSPHELAASAQGNIFLELKDGFMRRDLIDLVFLDIIGWAWTKTSGDDYYRFDCAILDYSLDQGVVSTQGFLLDADNIAITGEGTIDLGKEQVNYVFLPKKKSRAMRKADPVKITGALNDPSVKALPWKSATTTYGSLLFGPFIFAGVTAADYLGSKILRKAKEAPCLQYENVRGENRVHSE